MTAPADIAAVLDGTARIPRDGYFTPEPLALAIAQRLLEYISPPSRVLEPSSGGGAFVRAARATWPAAHVVAVDISPTARMFANGADFICADFLRYTPAEPFDLILGNPPFNDAEAHVRHALDLVRPGGWVTMLLRLAFVASQQRMRGICAGPGRIVAPIGPRPSFTGGGNDNSEYALFAWQQGATWASQLGEPLFWDRGAK